MYSIIKWVAYSLVVVSILPYSVMKPWGFRIAVVAALVSILFARLEGFENGKEFQNEADGSPEDDDV